MEEIWFMNMDGSTRYVRRQVTPPRTIVSGRIKYLARQILSDIT